MFSEERVEAIAAGYMEQIRKGLKTFEEAVKEVETTYSPEMREAIKKKMEEIRRIPTPVELLGERVGEERPPPRKLVGRVVVAKRLKPLLLDGVKVTYVASGEINMLDWRRLVKEKKDEEFTKKVIDELEKMGFILG